MLWRGRSLWVAVGAVAYVAFAALRTAEERAHATGRTASGVLFLALLGLPILVTLGFRATAPPTRGEDRVEQGARAAARVCIVGAAVLLAARGGTAGPGFLAIANLGGALASIGALYAIARIGSLGGLVEPPPGVRSLDAAAFAALLWTFAVALPAISAMFPERGALIEPVAIDYATVAASIGSLGITIAATLRIRAVRRLELGVGDRAWAALCLTVTALAIGVGSGLLGVLPPERILPLTAVVAALSVCATAVSREPTTVSRALRTVLALAALCVPVALLAVYATTQSAPARVGGIVFLASVAIALGGLLAPLLARRLAPEGARWLDAFEAATRAAMNPDPDAAVEAAMGALRETAGRVFGAPAWTGIGGPPAPPAGAGPRSRRKILGPTPPGAAGPEAAALYRLEPADVVTVDRAGYAQVRKAEVPERLVTLCQGEPERILATEAARSVEVRRPDVRPVLDWLDQRGIAASAIVTDDMGPVGILTIPRGTRTAPLTLEEARALRELADRLGAVLGVSAMLARSRLREGAARRDLEALRAEVERLGKAEHRNVERLETLARVLERPARAACYSPAARAAVEELERLGQTGRPVTLLVAPGVDPVPWASLTHLASSRHANVLAVVDGTSAAEHDLMRWRDPDASPLRIAEAGTLVLLDAHALPTPVQSYIAAALAEDAGIVVTVPSTVDSLVASGRMDERLADRLGDRAVALPALAARAEDLRALCLQQLSTIGLRVRGEPFGIDPAAQALLAEHAWPGNDAELESVLLRAALLAGGDVVGVRELAEAGFDPVRPARPPERARPSAGMVPIGELRRRRSGR